MKTLLTKLTAIILGLMFCGASCPHATAQQRLQNIGKAVAYGVTKKVLQKNPELRPQFELVRDELKIYEVSDAVDLITLIAILDKLPVKELKDGDLEIGVTAFTIAFSDVAGTLSVDRLNELKPVAKAIREGLDLALTQSSAGVPPAPTR